MFKDNRKSISKFKKRAKRLQEKQKAIERAIDNLRQEYQVYVVKISDIMSQMS